MLVLLAECSLKVTSSLQLLFIPFELKTIFGVGGLIGYGFNLTPLLAFDELSGVDPQELLKVDVLPLHVAIPGEDVGQDGPHVIG